MGSSVRAVVRLSGRGYCTEMPLTSAAVIGNALLNIDI